MRICEIAEFAALTADHGPLLVHSPRPLAAKDLERYWFFSKCRLDNWGRVLRRFRTVVAKPSGPAGAAGLVSAVIEEILVSEILTRVWTAVLSAYDRQRGEAELEPVARSVYVGHLEARNRALALLVHAPGVRVEEAVALNRLRQRAERWCDLLLGRLLSVHDVSDYAADPRRARDFAQDLRQEGHDEQAWSILLASLRCGFQQEFPRVTPHAELNQQIAGSILGCFPAEVFDSLGLLRSLWTTRILTTAADAQGMLDELFRLDRPRTKEDGPARRF